MGEHLFKFNFCNEIQERNYSQSWLYGALVPLPFPMEKIVPKKKLAILAEEQTMKLQCQIEVVNRTHMSLNIRSNGKYLKSTLALGKETKSENEYFILHFSTVNKLGTKYRLNFMKQVFSKYLNEGKVTIRFEEPPHDLCIKCEAIQLKCFMKLLKQCVTGEAKNLRISTLSNISITSKDNAPSKLVIRDRSDFPSKGLPRTLESLTLAGLKLCNFRRDILLLRYLSVLDLSSNEIEKMPPEFGRMPNLSELYLANNQLGSKGEVDWRWLLGPQLTNTLKLLDLSSNELKYLPKSIWKLQKLVTLKLDNNKLSLLPSTLGRIATLRYFTISQNELASLPCSLMQCHLEQLDISSNKFMYETFPNKQNILTLKNFYMGSLVNIASKVVLKHKLFYDRKTIPWTLVEFLDNANMCICGTPVVDTVFVKKEFDLKEYFRIVVCDARSSRVDFECYFCSPVCLRKLCRT